MELFVEKSQITNVEKWPQILFELRYTATFFLKLKVFIHFLFSMKIKKLT